MGIININEDSFYLRSREVDPIRVSNRAFQMFRKGAKMVDLGACSTRPGSKPIEAKEEIKLLTPPLKRIKKRFEELYGKEVSLREFISIDTYNTQTVEAVYELIGEFTINDITAGEGDKNMLKIVAQLSLPYIAMHNRGICALKGEELKKQSQYKNGVVEGVIEYFEKFERKAKDVGLKEWILDPGFGFAKTIEQNYLLLKNLNKLTKFKRPILVGLSRKSVIYKVLETTPEKALNGTTALNFYSLTQGAAILRVHDVPQAVETIKLYEQLKNGDSEKYQK